MTCKDGLIQCGLSENAVYRRQPEPETPLVEKVGTWQASSMRWRSGATKENISSRCLAQPGNAGTRLFPGTVWAPVVQLSSIKMHRHYILEGNPAPPRSSLFLRAVRQLFPTSCHPARCQHACSCTACVPHHLPASCLGLSGFPRWSLSVSLPGCWEGGAAVLLWLELHIPHLGLP